MNRAPLRTEPISLHLARHRDCLERRHAERRIVPAAAGRPVDISDLSPFDWHRQPFAMLPFDRQDDED
jgi:hypothetical protein